LTAESGFDFLGAVARLNEVSIYDYFKNRAMPEDVAPLIEKTLQGLRVSSRKAKGTLFDELRDGGAWAFAWFARVAAGRAVRESSSVVLLDGLISIGASATRLDPRDLEPTLALLVNSAERLEADVRADCAEASRIIDGRSDSFLSGFLGRPRRHRSIKLFGFSEGIAPHGFDYFPLPPDYGGPSPT
jgi:hypothetical protein